MSEKAGSDQKYFCQNCGQLIKDLEPTVDSPSSSFVLLDQDPRTNLSQKLKVADKLYKTMNGQDVSEPMCDECALELTELLNKQISNYEEEQKSYQAYLDTHVTVTVDPKETLRLEERLKEKKLELELIAKEQAKIDEEMAQLEHQLQKALFREEEFWIKLNNLDFQTAEYVDELNSLNLQSKQAQDRLDVLTNTNVYNDTFRIWHSGPFGTINDLRLGKLSSHNVEWSEINAAIGQCCLLLDSLCSKINFQFKVYRLVPLGSTSRIEKLEGDTIYGLYGSSDFSGIFSNRRFDLGLVAFIQCLSELGDYAKQKDSRFDLPYK